jgi:hypothetical protein
MTTVLQVPAMETHQYRTVVPHRFEDEQSVLQEWLSKTDLEGTILLDTSYFEKRDHAWRPHVTEREFDIFCAAHLGRWKQVADCLQCTWSARASLQMWRPRNEAAQVLDLQIPILTLLNDMMACASHPNAFQWRAFTVLHAADLVAYCMKFSRSDTQVNQDVRRRATKHLGRDLTSFCGRHLLPLWDLIVQDMPLHICHTVHVVIDRPSISCSNLVLRVHGVRDMVSVSFSKSADAPGEKCLVSFPSKALAMLDTIPGVPATNTNASSAPHAVPHRDAGSRECSGFA